MGKLINISIFTVMIFSLSACSVLDKFYKEDSKEEEVETPTCFMHKVKYPGETLAAISQWYTGDAKKWTEILKANEGLSERRIAIGADICIPYGMVIKQDPLPKPKVRPARSAEVKREIIKEEIIEDDVVDIVDSRNEGIVHEEVEEELVPQPFQDSVETTVDDNSSAEDDLKKTREELLREILQDEY